MSKSTFVLLFALFLSSCTGESQSNISSNSTSASANSKAMGPDLTCPQLPADHYCANNAESGISGMAKISADQFLVVHDQIIHKAGKSTDNDVAPRIRVLHADSRNATGAPVFKYESTKIDWSGTTSISNDLESACRLDGLSGHQFLIAESGTFGDDYGYLFHVELTLSQGQPPLVAIKSDNRLKLPDIQKVKNDHSVQEYEGMACTRVASDRYIVVLGERGDNTESGFDKGRLRWGYYTPSNMTLAWGGAAQSELNINAKRGSNAHVDLMWRDITGLHIDTQRRLWASAAHDSGSKTGPFDSVVYQLGYICVDQQDGHGYAADCDYNAAPRPKVFGSFSTTWTSPDRKIESIAAPAGATEPSYYLAIGTEDESWGGAFFNKEKLELKLTCPKASNINAGRRNPAFVWPPTIGANAVFRSAFRTVNETLSCSYRASGTTYIDIDTSNSLVCETSGPNWEDTVKDEPDFVSLTEDCTAGEPENCTVTCVPR